MDRRFAQAFLSMKRNYDSSSEWIIGLNRDVPSAHIVLEEQYHHIRTYPEDMLYHVALLLLVPDREVLSLQGDGQDIPARFFGDSGVASFEGARFNLSMRHKILRVTDENDSSMLEMTFDLHKLKSTVDGLYPGPMLGMQGIQSLGNYLLRLVDRFNSMFGIHHSSLIDVSSKEMCNNTKVPLGRLFLLAYGSSWYMRHGFLPRDDSDDLDEPNTSTHRKLLHLAHVRATTMIDLYTKTKALYVLNSSGLIPQNNMEFIHNVTTGNFFELLLQQLFGGNQRSCNGIVKILAVTDGAIVHSGYNIVVYDFVKRYDRVEEQLSNRVHRTNTKMFSMY
jgi:hypothetical protein